MSNLGILNHIKISRSFLYIFFISIVLVILYLFIYSETFANKNKQTALEVHGNILGMDLLDHPGTFDYVSSD
jgi:hypothetical protein